MSKLPVLIPVSVLVQFDWPNPQPALMPKNIPLQVNAGATGAAAGAL